MLLLNFELFYKSITIKFLIKKLYLKLFYQIKILILRYKNMQ